MSKKKNTAKTVNRNSANGQFVTSAYTKKNPKTTETQHVRVKKP